MTSDLFAFMPTALSGWEKCREALGYAPGYMQSRGVVVVWQASDLKIVQLSETVEQFFGSPVTAVIGKLLTCLSARLRVQKMVASLHQDTLDASYLFEAIAASTQRQERHL